MHSTTPIRQRARAERQLAELGRIKSPTRSSYLGIVDLAGFPRDRFHTIRRPALPMAPILPHRNWPQRIGQVTPAEVVYPPGELRGVACKNGAQWETPYREDNWRGCSYRVARIESLVSR